MELTYPTKNLATDAVMTSKELCYQTLMHIIILNAPRSQSKECSRGFAQYPVLE